MTERKQCPECNGEVCSINNCRCLLTGVFGPDGLYRHRGCHAKKMARLKDGPGYKATTTDHGAPGYVAR